MVNLKNIIVVTSTLQPCADADWNQPFPDSFSCVFHSTADLLLKEQKEMEIRLLHAVTCSLWDSDILTPIMLSAYLLLILSLKILPVLFLKERYHIFNSTDFCHSH